MGGLWRVVLARFLIRRVLLMIVSLLMIALITFSLMHAVPGGPFTAERQLPARVEAEMRAKYNLDAPLYVQFFDYVKGFLTFNLGPSFKYPGKTVNDFIENGFPVSAKLGGITILFILGTSIPLGIWAALKNGKWQDGFVMTLATLGVTIPSFVIATLLMYVFSFRLGWLPVFSLDKWQGYILPDVYKRQTY